MPSGMMNGIPCFQRKMHEVDKQTAYFAYLNNATICCNNIEEHNKNLILFLEAANLTFDKDKCVLSFITRLVQLPYFIAECRS